MVNVNLIVVGELWTLHMQVQATSERVHLRFVLCRILQSRCVDPATPVCLDVNYSQTWPWSGTSCLQVFVRVDRSGLVTQRYMCNHRVSCLITDPHTESGNPVLL